MLEGFMRRGYKRRPAKVLRSAREEVARLFAEAERQFDAGRKDLARRRVRNARRAAMKVQLRIPEHWHRYCRRCDNYLKQGVNCTIRIRKGIRIRRCLECGAVRRKIMREKSVRAPPTHPNSSSPRGSVRGA
ncbi:ribonuclease P [Candidatus Woesearchaeota archaeon]|nr:MAG: ribonuclease P [Candidatus Woesearchaeota archaeon]